MRRLRGAGSFADAFDDPARLLHDEAQRDGRDVSRDLAGVRRRSIRSPRRSRRRAIRRCYEHLEKMLCEITGFAAVSLQPNAGSQGEYAGLLVIRKYHQTRGEGQHRNVCLIPEVRARNQSRERGDGRHEGRRGRMRSHGNVDLADLRAKAEEHAKDLAALMITYPSTHGVFEEAIREICEIVHSERRPGLHGRREHERADRPLPSRRVRPRCLPSESAQDFLHSARRRRPGHGSDRRARAPGGRSCRRIRSCKTGGDKAIGAVSAAPGEARASSRSPGCTSR